MTLDPNLEVRPDFASGAYDAHCTALANTEGVEKVIIITCLFNTWDVENNAKKGRLYSAPLIPAGIRSFLQNPVDSGGMKFGRKACYFCHSGA